MSLKNWYEQLDVYFNKGRYEVSLLWIFLHIFVVLLIFTGLGAATLVLTDLVYGVSSVLATAIFIAGIALIISFLVWLIEITAR